MSGGPGLGRRSHSVLSAVGVLLQLAGLALDAVLHAADPTLASREGVFALGNPGHLLFAAGLGLTVLGVSMALLDQLIRKSHARAWTRGLPAVVVLAALALAGTALVGIAPGRGHTHDVVGDAGDTHGDEVPVTWEQLREIDHILTAAKTATEKYRDLDAARADGYLQMSPVLFELGAHFVNQQILDEGVFNVERPTILLYGFAAGGGLELVGVSWALPKSPDAMPPAYFAPLAHWHEHNFTNRCIGTGGPAAFMRAQPLTEEECRRQGHVYFAGEHWYVHAWIFRPSPEGVFSHRNSTVE